VVVVVIIEGDRLSSCRNMNNMTQRRGKNWKN
jgi:hypothetical protein